MRFISIFIVGGLLSLSVFGQNTIVRQNVAKHTYTSLQTAIDVADVGDTLYLSAGTYSEPEYLVDKRLVIYGAGWDDKSANGVSVIKNTLRIVAPADYTQISGLKIHSLLMNVLPQSALGILNEVQVASCYFYGSVDLGDTGTSGQSTQNIDFRQCVFNCTVDFENATVPIISNCHFRYGASGVQLKSADGAWFQNCVFVNEGSTPQLYSFTLCTFVDNIFITDEIFAAFPGSADNEFSHNLIASTSQLVLDGQLDKGNEISPYSAAFFASVPDVYTWNAADDYTFTSDIVVGGPVGIYVGNFPWKPNNHHAIPRIDSLNIGKYTDENGKLFLFFRAEAQTQP